MSDEREKILVSACLLGKNCKYNGGNNSSEAVKLFCEGRTVIPVCPEVMGGLPTPRIPAERVGGRVLTRDGRDVTEAYRRGARLTLELAEREGARLALLQSRSPSCGVREIYDGSFTGKKIKGMGVTAGLLADHGISLIDAGDLEN